jgi:hypothetical protein
VPQEAEKNVRPEDAQFLDEYLNGESETATVASPNKKTNYQLKGFEKFKPKGEQ